MRQVHNLNWKIVINLMINYIFEQHIWLKESRKKDDKKN